MINYIICNLNFSYNLTKFILNLNDRICLVIQTDDLIRADIFIIFIDKFDTKLVTDLLAKINNLSFKIY